jgi:transcription elongation factor Elf1
MSNYLESKYLNLLSAQLQQFKRKNDTLWNFRCPYCGDSQTNENKARGYVFLKEASYIFKCHNCGQGASLNNLIKHVNPSLHKEYTMEKFKDGGRKIANNAPAKNPNKLSL